jgi:hypothetical protein
MTRPEDWVVVEVANSEPEAELLCSVLRSAGIECLPRLTNRGAGAGDGLGPWEPTTSWSVRGTRKMHARSCAHQISRMQLHEIGSMDHAPAVQGLKCADLVDAMGRLHRHRGE